MDEKIFVGYNYGTWTTKEGELKEYCNVFFLEDFKGSESDKYHFAGQKASKVSCVGPHVWKGIEVGGRVLVAKNDRSQISYMVPASKA